MTSTEPTLVAVENLTLRRGSFCLDSVSLTLDPHEILAIIGKTGAGKTLLLEAIAGFLNPDGGQVCYHGVPVQAVPLHRRNIGYLYQDYNLFPHLTAGENIGYGLKLRRLPRNEIRTQVAEMAAHFGITAILGQYPGTLSGGEQQRVALARALITHPALLLLDEPFSALDPVTKERFYGLMRGIREDFHCGVIFVTHNFNEAEELADRVGVLMDGRLMGIVPSQALYTADWSPAVREFLGIVPGEEK
ncbi:MAG: ABC transporter ATP-binding protein [Christensenella sp.]|uniref:ABC transporter ATP-binding protein n=1 Tax=Christensenella sp. TaxID=1935934 RepID=UPI002B1FADF6|nr:ABC transporter ATP-binding protein [Christensenella sp.]MEA5002525.1 ABC transporter ATP-binding protein [Christensenella sp.]